MGPSLTGREILVNNFLRRLRGTFSSRRSSSPGTRDALLWSTALDLWYRYRAVLQVLERELSPRMRILEVGSRWFGFEFFMPKQLSRSTLLVQLDVAHRPLRAPLGPEEWMIASGAALPFRDSSFDFVLAMDALENVPRPNRQAFCNELRRVAARSVMIHTPLQSDDGSFRALEFDHSFQRWFQGTYGREEANTWEHLTNGHPTPAELAAYFPGSSIAGTQNAGEWYGRVLHIRPLLGAVALALRSALRGGSPRPPYYSALLVWRQSS